jgi:hypothetical protein
MLIELLVGAGVVALGAIALKALRRSQEPGGTADPGGAGSPAPAKALSEPSRPPTRIAGPRGLRVGDVLLYADPELWLAGEVYLDEEGFALSLFHSPGASRASWVVQLDAEARELALVAPSTEVPGGAVPTELPIGGMRLSLRRRGQADVRTGGEHLPPTTERARYAVLGGPGGRTLVVVDFEGGDRLALVGDRVGREMVDLLPGGDLES